MGNMYEHNHDCLYGNLVQSRRKSLLLTDEDVRQELGEKYRKEIVKNRSGCWKEKKKGRGVTDSFEPPLTPIENALVEERLEQAMSFDGPVRFYLDMQRMQFEEIKLSLYRQCQCHAQVRNNFPRFPIFVPLNCC